MESKTQPLTNREKKNIDMIALYEAMVDMFPPSTPGAE